MEKENPLVSIITPCYNGENVMHRLLDSILSQTYSNIEFILINDGSTDHSEEIWYQYEKKKKKKGIKTIYIHQRNQGLGAAINAGLKVFTGDYLCWPDIDDYFEDTSVEKRVNFLETHKEYGSVSSDANQYMEDNLSEPVGTMASWLKHKEDEWQFEWLLKGQSLFCSGCHMLRTTSFLDVNPDRYIYPARRGQNNQMLLPIYYKYKHGFIDEPLYNYIVYKKSMSTPDITEESALDRINEYLELLRWTFKQIMFDEKTEKMCMEELRKIQWNDMSKIFVEYGHPILFLKLYFSLKMYQTEMKKELKSVLLSIKQKWSNWKNVK